MATLAERILSHLAAHPVRQDALDVPREVTQEGIADACGARVAHVSRALSGLAAKGLVTARVARVRGARRSSRAHALTDAGLRAAGDLHLAPDEVAPARPAPRPRRLVHEAELRALLESVDAVAGGGPRIVLLEGEAGSGKTTLLEAFAGAASERKVTLLWGRAAPAGGEQLVGPLAEALSRLGFEARFRSRSVGTPRERALAAAADAIVSAAREAPVVLVLDDVHLAGASAAEFLHGVVRKLPVGTRALVVAAFRREEAWALPNGALYTALAPMREAPLGRHVVLGPVAREGVAALLAEAGVRLPDDLVERVRAESGGVPLYVAAMAEALADGVDESDFFPPAVAAAVRERFASLPPDALEALRGAAVCGADLDGATLSRAWTAGGAPQAALVDAIDVLLDKLLLEEGADGRLRFEHPKVREAVLADMTAARRGAWAERVAKASATGAS